MKKKKNDFVFHNYLLKEKRSNPFFVEIDSTLDNGRTVKEKEEANKYGVMDRNMKDTGIMIWLTVKED